MKQVKHDCELNNCFLCKNVLKEWLPALKTCRKTYHFAKGETIFEESHAVKGIYFINRGKVKVHMKWENDKELIVRFAGDGDILGHRGYGKELIYPVSATALAPSDICFIDNAFFFATLRTNNDFLFKMTMFFAEELKVSEKKMRDIALVHARERLIKAVGQLKDFLGMKDEAGIYLGISKHDLASYIGTTYETLSRLLNELEDEGIVYIDAKKIYITEP